MMPTAEINNIPTKTASDNGSSHLYLFAVSGGRLGSGFGETACRKALAVSGRRKPVGFSMFSAQTERLAAKRRRWRPLCKANQWIGNQVFS